METVYRTDWANLHSVVVDRMSFDAEVEKNKKLTRTIDGLRYKKQELQNTLAKVQKTMDKYANYKDGRCVPSHFYILSTLTHYINGLTITLKKCPTTRRQTS